MRIRNFIAAIMILLSLSAQARTAFACGMMPGAALAHCCCPGQGKDLCPGGGTGAACCDQVTATDAPFGPAVAATYDKHHAPINPLDLPPPVAPAFHLLAAVFDAGSHTNPLSQPDASRHRIRPLYLQTARLRL